MTYMCVAETRQPGFTTNWSVVRWASDRNTRAGSSHPFQAGQGKLTARCDDADVMRVSAVDSSLPAGCIPVCRGRSWLFRMAAARTPPPPPYGADHRAGVGPCELC